MRMTEVEGLDKAASTTGRVTVEDRPVSNSKYGEREREVTRGRRERECLRSIQTVIDLFVSCLGLGASIMSPTLSHEVSASERGVNLLIA